MRGHDKDGAGDSDHARTVAIGSEAGDLCICFSQRPQTMGKERTRQKTSVKATCTDPTRDRTAGASLLNILVS